MVERDIATKSIGDIVKHVYPQARYKNFPIIGTVIDVLDVGGPMVLVEQKETGNELALDMYEVQIVS